MRKKKRKKILFISHESSLTGAPILLLNLLQLVKSNDEYDLHILSIKKGPLYADFAKTATISCIKNEDYRKEKNLIHKLYNIIIILIRSLLNIRFWLWADVVFNNTSVNGKFLKFYSAISKKKIVSYIHELENYVLSDEIYASALATVQLSHTIVSPNSYNQQVMKKIFSAPDDKYRILQYFLSNDKTEPGTIQNKAIAKAKLLSQVKIDEEQLIVLGMGTFGMRKGADYFIDTAHQLKDHNIQFCWIGSAEDDNFTQLMKEKINNNEINNFHFLGPREHSYENYLPFDVLFLSSREDPYPVVVLEAASMAVPAVYFTGSGGIGEFIDEKCGWKVEGYSPKQAAELIRGLNDKEIKEKGYQAREKVIKWHFDRIKIYSDFKEIIEIS